MSEDKKLEATPGVASVKGSESLFSALETLCQDSLESSLEEVRKWPPGDQITDAMHTVLREVDTLRSVLDELLDTAERMRGGDPSLDPEQWYAIRDAARVTLERQT